MLYAAFSPDGTLIVTASADKTARVWDAASRRTVVTLAGHQGPVNSSVFSPDGTYIVTASDDKTARVWEADSGRAVVTLVGHDGEVKSAAFSGDGGQVVTASWDSTARILGLRERARDRQAREPRRRTAVGGPQSRRDAPRHGVGEGDCSDLGRSQPAGDCDPQGARRTSILRGLPRRRQAGSDRRARRRSADLDVSAIPKGNILNVACALLPDRKLDNLGSNYSFPKEKPICTAEAPGPDPAPIDAAK